ncbi:chemotaxis protein CheW [Desulfuribacillus alkaliarsenatis]|uniref:Chemotaxis protein CheW n=1 Tax=Desulfuribacillus alkaliarsenatis TaxID=766136 RepID=A0A1E5G626_9FIRM|nr:chemotaxis protein CheW [Desulfuribacillus alkaliarsenatis]OEF98626.1 chemotaxis protein CheW [Desulfuribacillus alkaliarsenatis]
MNTEGKNYISKEIKVIVFRLREQEYGVDVNQVKSIERVQDITKVPEAPNFVKGIIDLRGVVTPIIDLRTRLNLSVTEDTDNTRVIIVNIDGVEVGLIVDSANDVIDIPISSIEPPPPIAAGVRAVYLHGVAKLEDRLLILLNLNKVLSSDEIKIIDEIGTDNNGSIKKY